MVFADIVAYLNETKNNPNYTPIFRLDNLVKMYTDGLQNYGIEDKSQVSSTRLKERFLRSIPDLEADMEGRVIILAFNKNIGLALKQVRKSDQDEDAIILSIVADLVRRNMLAKKNKLLGSFEKELPRPFSSSSFAASC